MAVYVSDLLTATAAPVNAAPASTRALQWLRGSTTISGATSTTYTTTADDLGSTISARQSETNFLGTTTATSAATETVEAYNPAALFRSSEPGVWFDPNDITTLFQDAAGKIPVTGPVGPAGQAVPVGLMLDKSRGLVLGPELVDTANTAAGWFTYGTNTVVQEGDAVKVTFVNDAQGAGFYMTAAGGLNTNLTIGKTYLFTCQVKASGGTVSVAPFFFNGSSTGAGSTAVSSTDYTTVTFRLLEYTGGAPFVRLETPVGTTGWIRSISVKELAGNHATQATETKRPNYGIVPAGGRRNLLTYSEDFRNTAAAGEVRPWGYAGATIDANTTTAPDGTVTADLIKMDGSTGQHIVGVDRTSAATGSCTVRVSLKYKDWRYAVVLGTDVGNAVVVDLVSKIVTYTGASVTNAALSLGLDDWVTLTFTMPQSRYFYIGLNNGASYSVSFAGTSGLGFYLWGAQLEQSATATPYQRVTTQYDVTEAGVASLGYLQFDGTDDWMFTGTITPGIDKAQVFAGVRKLSDVTVGVVADLGPGNTGGSFVLYNQTPSGYGFNSLGSGSASAAQVTSGYAAPITNVLTGIGDISGDIAALRVNGTQVAQNTGDQGTSNYLAYPLFIGSRGNAGPPYTSTTLPLNGQLFPLIVRFGTTLTTARIQSTEIWVGERTPGIDLEKVFSPIIYARDNTAVLDRANSTIERRAV